MFSLRYIAVTVEIRKRSKKIEEKNNKSKEELLTITTLYVNKIMKTFYDPRVFFTYFIKFYETDKFQKIRRNRIIPMVTGRYRIYAYLKYKQYNS